MASSQMSLDLGGKPTVRAVLDRIRAESRDESEKGRWFEQLFMRVALQQPEFELDAIWRWADWPEREALTGLDGRDNPAWSSLRDAFDRVCDTELLPMRLAEDCAARQIIDDAAALALGVARDVVADWRRRLAAEPTITNARANDDGEGQTQDS